MTIKIEIPSDNKALAGVIGRALSDYAVAETLTITGSGASDGEYVKTDPDNVVELGQQFQAATKGPQTDATSEDSHAEQEEEKGQDFTALSNGKTDIKNVPFIPAICGEAKDPFYASGPRKGQWKKKRNVSDETYDMTYNNALAQVNTSSIGDGIADDTAALQTQNPAATIDQTAEEVFGEQQTQQTANVGPQQVFELWSTLVQSGKVNKANGIMQKHGLANGTLIYGRPDLVDVIFPKLQAIEQQGA